MQLSRLCSTISFVSISFLSNEAPWCSTWSSFQAKSSPRLNCSSTSGTFCCLVPSHLLSADADADLGPEWYVDFHSKRLSRVTPPYALLVRSIFPVENYAPTRWNRLPPRLSFACYCSRSTQVWFLNPPLQVLQTVVYPPVQDASRLDPSNSGIALSSCSSYADPYLSFFAYRHPGPLHSIVNRCSIFNQAVVIS